MRSKKSENFRLLEHVKKVCSKNWWVVRECYYAPPCVIWARNRISVWSYFFLQKSTKRIYFHLKKLLFRCVRISGDPIRLEQHQRIAVRHWISILGSKRFSQCIYGLIWANWCNLTDSLKTRTFTLTPVYRVIYPEIPPNFKITFSVISPII